jgi:hypothetical protein
MGYSLADILDKMEVMLIDLTLKKEVISLIVTARDLTVGGCFNLYLI